MVNYYLCVHLMLFYIQFFNTVDWERRRAFAMQDITFQQSPNDIYRIQPNCDKPWFHVKIQIFLSVPLPSVAHPKNILLQHVVLPQNKILKSFIRQSYHVFTLSSLYICCALLLLLTYKINTDGAISASAIGL